MRNLLLNIGKKSKKAFLSQIDTSKKNSQPMKYNDTIISYNGEIYNYLDIKRKFKNDFTNYETNGDTEVLLKLWNLKGINSFY